jgi:hypothetical protein
VKPVDSSRENLGNLGRSLSVSNVTSSSLGFRIAHQYQTSPISNTPRKIYHTLQPHPALAPVPDDPLDTKSIAEQESNERAWRNLLAQGVLTVLLPIDDLRNGCFRELVNEILSEIILGNVLGNRLCEGWTLWKLITNLIESAQSSGESRKRTGAFAVVGDVGRSKKRNTSIDKIGSTTEGNNPKTRLEKFGLLKEPTTEPPVQIIRSDSPVPQTLKPLSSSNSSSLANSLWTLLNYGLLVITAGRAVMVTLLSASSLPPRSSYQFSSLVEPDQEQKKASTTPRPLINMGIWRLTTNLFQLPFRMPWLAGLLSLVYLTVTNGPSAVGKTDGTLDR